MQYQLHLWTHLQGWSQQGVAGCSISKRALLLVACMVAMLLSTSVHVVSSPEQCPLVHKAVSHTCVLAGKPWDLGRSVTNCSSQSGLILQAVGIYVRFYVFVQSCGLQSM